MAIFKRKKKDFIDLSEHYRRQQEKAANLRNDLSEGNSMSNSPSQETNSGVGIFGGMFGGSNDSGSSTSSYPNSSDAGTTEAFGETVNPEERRRKLARRLKEMTEKIEDLSNQIYHLQNRLEVVERKSDGGRF